MKYIAYYRVSKLSTSGKARKEKGESALGIEAQKYIVRNYYGSDIVQEFEEVASAKDLNRPVLQQAIEKCVAEGLTFVTAKIDRISRNVEDALAIYERLGHRMVSCDVPNLDKFTLTLFAAFAERERTLIQLRIKSALRQKIDKEGHWYNPETAHKDFINGTIAAKGREVLSQKAKSNPNNIRAAQMISAWKRSGLTWDQVISKLNENEFRTSRGFRFSEPVQAVRMLVICKDFSVGSKSVDQYVV